MADRPSTEHLAGHRKFFQAIADAAPMSEVGIRGLFLVAECEELHRQLAELRKAELAGAPLTLEELKRATVVNAIESAAGNYKQAAATLGISRGALYSLTARMGIKRHGERGIGEWAPP